MRKKILTFLLVATLIFALFYKSPFSAKYNYDRGKALYLAKNYEQAIPYFERSLFANPNGILARFYYVLSLSKSKPTYSVQKKLYEMSNSKINDEATRYAKTQIPYIKHKLINNLGDNYIHHATSGSDIIRWDIKSFPLNVYIEKSEDIPQYYIQSIKNALAQWSSKTNFVKFKITQNEDEAKIIIKFQQNKENNCAGTNCKFVAAHTEPDVSKNSILDKMILTFSKTNPLGKTYTQNEIYNTAVHELGHTLGILGHSDNPNDVMFAEQNTNAPLDYFKSENNILSKRDLNTLVLLYHLKPTISDTKNLQSESFYYPQLVIGNDDERLMKKLKELTDYINNYPNLSAGYINISAIYSELGDFEKANNNLNKALTYSKTNDEKYLIYYNKAILQFNQQNSKQALEYAQKAQKLKNDEKIQELISDIKNLSK